MAIKRVWLLVLLVLVCLNANTYAQPASFIYRPTPAAIGIIPGSTGAPTSALTDNFGRILLSPSSAITSTATISPTRGNGVHTQPTVNTAASTTCLASNALRSYFIIQNNSAANIMINLSATPLTGIIPSPTNPGIVLLPNTSYESPPNFVTTNAITCYQTSGGAINTISVFEG